MLDFGRADAMGQRPEGAMGGGVAVAADDGRAGQGEALLGPDHMDDALALVALGKIFDAEISGVLRQRLDLDAAFLFLDALRAVRGRDIVIHHGQCLFRRADLAAGQAEAFKSLRGGDLMHEMAIDIEQAGPIRLTIDHMVLEDLVVQGGRRAHRCSPWHHLVGVPWFGFPDKDMAGVVQGSGDAGP